VLSDKYGFESTMICLALGHLQRQYGCLVA